MRRINFLKYYTLVEKDGQHIQPTRAAALALADNDPTRVWAVRENVRDWDVESDSGQFVNVLGWFVTTEPCCPEHVNRIFLY